MQSQNRNIAIISRNAINLAVLLNKLPQSKLLDYDKYPLTFRIGFIHSIPEKDFDLTQATITDVGYLGLFPKAILQALGQYAKWVEQQQHNKADFLKIIDKLFTAFIYRLITIQKVIQILVTNEKNKLDSGEQRYPTPMQDEEQTIASRVSQGQISCAVDTQDTSKNNTPPPLRTCYANKCRLLKARGILRHPMFCINNKNMCSGCLNENMQQKHML